MIGLYDSGLGGLTVLRALRAAGVDADIVYFADQAHVPYGDRSDDELQTFLRDNFALLGSYGVGAIVMACNTSCAVASRNGGFPATRFPVLDLIQTFGESLRGRTGGRIAVFATRATVRSGAYGRAVRAHVPDAEVFEIEAPELVPLVERGAAGTRPAYEAVEALCGGLPPALDAIVYGCTHYPMLDDAFAAVLGAHVERIDPAAAQAAATKALLEKRGMPQGSAATHYVTNGDLGAFRRNVRSWTADTRGTFAEAVAAKAFSAP